MDLWALTSSTFAEMLLLSVFMLFRHSFILHRMPCAALSTTVIKLYLLAYEWRTLKKHLLTFAPPLWPTDA
jgi:hypothetical protein